MIVFKAGSNWISEWDVYRLTLLHKIQKYFHQLHWADAFRGSIPIDEKFWWHGIE